MNNFNHWTRIDINTLSSYLAVPQLNALTGFGFGDVKNNSAIEEIVFGIVARVRSELGYLTVLPKDPHVIPDEVKSSTCHLIIEALFSRIPALRLSTDQVRNAERAREHIRSLVQMHQKTFGTQKSGQTALNAGHTIVGKSRDKRVNTDDLKGL